MILGLGMLATMRPEQFFTPGTDLGVNVASGGSFGGGTGTLAAPYVIEDVWDLQNMSANLMAHYVLGNDIDASGTSGWDGGLGFLPVGNATHPFNGTLDGLGHHITGLCVNRSSNNNVGLFGVIGREGAVSNVRLVAVNVTGNWAVGGLAGNSTGTITSCNTTGLVNGTARIGGLVGQNSGNVTECHQNISLSGAFSEVGGLAGWNDVGGMMVNCSNAGTISGTSEVGGLVGRVAGDQRSFSHCFATGNVQGSGQYIGGLVGRVADVYGNFSHCFATGNVQGSGLYVGGLVGQADWTSITYCYAEGHVSGNNYVGGLVGHADWTNITYCYAEGNVSGRGYSCGGFVGVTRGGKILDCYAEGNVSGYSNIGGLVGRSDEGVTISHSYATGNVSAGLDYAGGLVGIVGNNGCTISLSYATGNVSAGRDYAGGLVGVYQATSDVGIMISQSYATGNVSAGRDYAGGLVASPNNATISDCFAVGTVSAGGMYAGGLVAHAYGTEGQSSVENCYAAGHVSGNGFLGGLFGANSGAMVSSCFWDNETSGQSTSAGGTGKNTTEMKTPSTFTDAGWDFTTIWWWFNDGSPSTYPRLGRADLSYDIRDIKDLALMKYDLNGHYKLVNDIDASATTAWYDGQGFSPVGSNASNQFNGTLDGNGFSIRGLFMNWPYTRNVGLFGYCSSGFAISNTTFKDCNITGQHVVGVAAGRAHAVVWNCHVINSSVRCDTGHGVSNCAGGLVGYLQFGGTISNCRMSGVNLYASSFVGGLIGLTESLGTTVSISNCSATGNFRGENDYVGGLVGRGTNTNFINCYAAGNVSGNSYLGGLVGDTTNYAKIMDCYATGSVSGNSYLGGLVGSGANTDIINCYAAGHVSGNSYLGGLIGNTLGSMVPGCFWDIETSGMLTSAGGTGRTTTEMRNIFSFLHAGWDFERTWDIRHTHTYPFFLWESRDYPPEACNDYYFASEDSVLSVPAAGLLGNDDDWEMAALSVSACDSVSALGATVTWNADGSFIYNPIAVAAIQALAAGDFVMDHFIYTVYDGIHEVQAMVYVNVSGASDPVGNPDNLENPEVPLWAYVGVTAAIIGWSIVILMFRRRTPNAGRSISSTKIPNTSIQSLPHKHIFHFRQRLG